MTLNFFNIHLVSGFPLIHSFPRTVVWQVRRDFGWGQSILCFIFLYSNLIDLICGSFRSLVHPSSQAGEIIWRHSGNFQRGPSQNTPASQLNEWPWGWGTETGSWCCGRVLPCLRRCVWLLCWWCCNAGRPPVRTLGWKTRESSLEGCITGSCGERDRRGRQRITWERHTASDITDACPWPQLV